MWVFKNQRLKTQKYNKDLKAKMNTQGKKRL